MIIHQIPLSEAQPLSLRNVDEDMLAFWLPYMTRKIALDIPIKDDLHIRLEPYYEGSIFGENAAEEQNFAIDLDYGSEQPVTLLIPNNIINLILGNFLSPLLPEHFESNFLCNILEIILIEPINTLRGKTGIVPKFCAFTGLKGNFKASWRLYLNHDSDTYYPLMVMGEQKIIADLMRKLFAKATYTKSVMPLVDLKIVSIVRKMPLSQLRSLKIGEIIVLFTKRHPVNEPLVIIGNKIVCHTVLNGMELCLTQDPQRIQDTEELKMTIHEENIDAIHEENENYDTEDTEHNDHENTPQSRNNIISEALHDLKVTVTFELNRMEMSTNAVSQLREGSIVNLNKQITEDVYLTIAGRTIALGEVVQVGRNFGVLIKEVL